MADAPDNARALWDALLEAGAAQGLVPAGLASREGVEVDGMEAAEVSYPTFERDLATLIA